MNRIVLDASALLAFLNQEPGADRLTTDLLSGAACSAVNLSEVQGKLVGRGLTPDEAWEAALGPVHEVAPFTSEQAKLAGTFIAKTRALGLSLADCACLALGVILDAPVYTTDKSWSQLNLGIPIELLR
jgi:PIN domain nuclease of toxin-antitoxin system